MSLKPFIRELPVKLGRRLLPREPALPDRPNAIFVLRNNDIGDLLVATPLFEALRRHFPDTPILAGVGDWNRDVLANNPHVSEVIPINAPWYNHVVQPQRPWDCIRYLLTSREPATVARLGCDVGLDVFGSTYGALLLMRAGIVHRLGVRGYRGGDEGFTRAVSYDDTLHVSKSALRLAELMGVRDLPEPRPQLFLSEDEQLQAEQRWKRRETAGRLVRVMLGPGAGDAIKCWPLDSFAILTRALQETGGVNVVLVGGKSDAVLAESMAAGAPGSVSLCGRMSLRETFALVASSDLVICNGSMLMHTAAAFRRPTLVVLAEGFRSASHHQQQWGYPETCRSLGRDVHRDTVFSAEEVFQEARTWIGF